MKKRLRMATTRLLVLAWVAFAMIGFVPVLIVGALAIATTGIYGAPFRMARTEEEQNQIFDSSFIGVCFKYIARRFREEEQDGRV